MSARCISNDRAMNVDKTSRAWSQLSRMYVFCIRTYRSKRKIDSFFLKKTTLLDALRYGTNQIDMADGE